MRLVMHRKPRLAKFQRCSAKGTFSNSGLNGNGKLTIPRKW